MDKLALLKQISFGERVAEQEMAELSTYFVETDQWNRIYRGEINVIRGEKGAGKSAIYSLLIAKTDELFDRRILLAAAEKPRGATVFKDLVADPPTSEYEFVGMWKLYILTLIADKLREFDVKGADAAAVLRALTDAGLLDEAGFDLASILRAIRTYARTFIAIEGVEGGLKVDPATGSHGFTGKITFREPSPEMKGKGYSSVDALIRRANAALQTADYQVWVLFDRLNVAFAESAELEANALRALFRVYLDLAAYDNIKLKIFLRSDIWKRITEGGLREASHITRFVLLEWKTPSLLNLIVRRLLKNAPLVNSFNINRDEVLKDFEQQKKIFYIFFPAQVDQGIKRPSTLDWLVSRTADGTDKTAPRELIHLLSSIRETEIARLERGEPPAPDPQLFDRPVFKAALPAVSEARLVQTLYAEYSDAQRFLEKLKGEKTEQTAESLAAIWDVSEAKATEQAQQLVNIGFFQQRGSREQPTYWVPFLYRDALHMVQGLAEEG